MNENKFNEEKEDVKEMIENIKQMNDIEKAKVQGVMLGMKMIFYVCGTIFYYF